MKKSWKIFWTICAGLGILGVALCVTGLFMGANINDAFGTAGLKGGVAGNYEESFEGIDVLNLDVDLSEVYVKEGEEGRVRVTVESSDPDATDIYVEQEGHTLNIESRSDKRWLLKNYNGEERIITVYLPSKLLSADLKIQAGYLDCDVLNAGEISVESKAAEVIISSMNARKAELELAAGRMEAYGTVEQAMEIDCNAGEVYFVTEGDEESYDYDIECNTGTVALAGKNYREDYGREAYITNHAGRMMNIDCEVGSVSIEYGLE